MRSHLRDDCWGHLDTLSPSIYFFFFFFTDTVGKRSDKVMTFLLKSMSLSHGFCLISPLYTVISRLFLSSDLEAKL